MKHKYQMHCQYKHQTPFNYYRSIFRYAFTDLETYYICDIYFRNASGQLRWQLYREQFTRHD